MRDGAAQAIFVIMSTVSRRDRLTDLAALVLILAGIALYLDAGARDGRR